MQIISLPQALWSGVSNSISIVKNSAPSTRKVLLQTPVDLWQAFKNKPAKKSRDTT